MTADPRYRLAPVRAARERDEAARRNELAGAVGAARDAHAELEVARARVAAAERALAAAIAALPSGATTPARVAIAERFAARRRRELADARDAELRAAAAHADRLGAVDGARGRLVRVRAERELIERHFARWRDAQKKLAERREE